MHNTERLVVLAERQIVDLLRHSARNARVFGPGDTVCGHTFRLDQLIIQPGWEPTGLEREWVAHHVYVRFGPDDFEEAVEAIAKFLPARMRP